MSHARLLEEASGDADILLASDSRLNIATCRNFLPAVLSEVLVRCCTATHIDRDKYPLEKRLSQKMNRGWSGTESRWKTWKIKRMLLGELESVLKRFDLNF